MKVKVLYGEGKTDIISQYVDFTKVYQNHMKLHGKTREAVLLFNKLITTLSVMLYNVLWNQSQLYSHFILGL